MRYALDIETDTSDGGGLDPGVAGITSVAILGEDGSSVLLDDTNEVRLLEALCDWLSHCPTGGELVTWNGAVFDFPYLQARCELLGVGHRFLLKDAPAIVPKYEPTPGFVGGCDVVVTDDAGAVLLTHRDIAYEFKPHLPEGVSWSLKPVATHYGMDPISVDREAVSDLTTAERIAYNLSDVEVTLALAAILDQILSGLS